MQRRTRIVVIGAGMGGMVSALELAVAGFDVTLVEKEAAPGGKMRLVEIGDARLDAGPTVLTMRWVFEEIFARAGTSVDAEIVLRPATILARHAWSETERLDLFQSIDRSEDAIARFASPAEGRRYKAFCTDAKAMFDALDAPYIRASRPSPQALVARAGLRGLAGLVRTRPMVAMWKALEGHFTDPRLRQLFGRYATYCGSSPFLAPATLMLVAHVEQAGVWYVEGGMHALARTLVRLAEERGVRVRLGAQVASIDTRKGRVTGVTLQTAEEVAADAVVFNGDAQAIATGRLGKSVQGAVPAIRRNERSLSALAWNALATPSGFPLVRHNVFFSRDYPREFSELLGARKLPSEPTTYICAQDRLDEQVESGPERLLILVNAPAEGDRHPFAITEISSCQTAITRLLERCGLTLQTRSDASVMTTPKDFEALFPATGGALYGMATHGWKASFSRPAAKTRIPGLYLAGGSVHPGPGVPMAALSGVMAASTLKADLGSIPR